MPVIARVARSQPHPDGRLGAVRLPERLSQILLQIVAQGAKR